MERTFGNKLENRFMSWKNGTFYGSVPEYFSYFLISIKLLQIIRDN